MQFAWETATPFLSEPTDNNDNYVVYDLLERR